MLFFKNNLMLRCLVFMLQYCFLENGYVKILFYNICYCWYILFKEYMFLVDVVFIFRIIVNRRVILCIFFLNVISLSLFVW